LVYDLEFRPAASRDLKRFDPPIREKVFADIEKLSLNPRPVGAEKLVGPERLYRARVGPGKNYRVIYQIKDEILVVLVVRVGDRKQVYRGIK
jgi:mRNA interferase RelE/StbE